MNEIPPPPRQLDGAEVLLWSASRRGLFHTIPHGSDPAAEGVIAVAAMAICRYPDGDCYYLFKCDRNWNVVFDWDAASVEEAQEIAASQSNEVIQWSHADPHFSTQNWRPK